MPSEQTILIAVVYANNETGTLLPVKEVATIAAEHGIYSLSDTVQAVGKVPVDFRAPRTPPASLPSGTLLDELDQVGIACSAGSRELSRVLSAVGLGDELIRSSVRFSLGCHTSSQDIDTVLTLLPGLVDKLRAAVL